jgi:hypothetical protein
MRSCHFLLLTALALTGCTRTIETRVSNAGLGQKLEQAGFVLMPPEKTASSELLKARSLVIAKLTTLGMTESKDGPLYLEVGVSARPASTALLASGRILSSASGKKQSRNCPQLEHRLSLALTRISDGAEIYRASAEEMHCKLPLTETLPILVEKAMADLGNPRGEYVTQRVLK